MKVVIIEDEHLAVEKLWRNLKKYNDNVELIVHLTSVTTAAEWFAANKDGFDLVFMDIQLEDGLSFEIFTATTIEKPIIFTTAFDQYAIEAFKVNSIDYLMKPISYKDLERALQKVEQLKFQLNNQVDFLKTIHKLPVKKYKDRFLVKLGNYIESLKADEISHFYAEGRTVYLISSSSKKFIVDYKLQELEELLDPNHYHRVNRSTIINIDAIKNVAVYSNSRLNVVLHHSKDEDTIVSRERVPAFKQWLDR